MTIDPEQLNDKACPAEEVLKLLAGKWKPQIMRLALSGAVRFNSLLKQLPGSSKQPISQALRDLEAAGVLVKKIVKLKPLHIEYSLSEKGQGMVPIFKSMEGFSEQACSNQAAT
jgi:DNA-binding HxlR family transcriptional regulator